MKKFVMTTFAAILALAFAAAPALHAAPGTWNANADGDWNTPGNWDSGTVAAGAGSLATLGDFIDADRTINLDIAPIIGGITAADTTHNYTISGANTLTLDSTGSSAVNVTTAGRTLTIASVLAGSDGITKSGAGTLALSNANSISGTFALTVGALQLGNATSMGSSTLTMTSGTTLQLRNDADTTFTAPINTAPTTGVIYNFDVNNAGSAVTDKKLSLGILTFATSISATITNTINVTGGNGYTLGLGTISAPSNSPGFGPHPLVINATTAAVEIAKFSTGSYGSALTFQGGNAITLTNFEMGSNGNNSLTVSGSGTVATLGTTTQTNNRGGGTAAYTLTSGTLNLTTTTSLANIRNSGTANAATFTITGGTLNNTSGSALILAANSGVTAGSPTITLGGNFAFGTVSSTSLNNLNLGTGAITNAGNRTITINGTGTTLTMGGTMTNTSGANQTTTVNGAGNTLSLGAYNLSNNNTARTGIFNGDGNVTISGIVANGGTGAGNLTYSGTGTLTLSAPNTFSGKTTVTSGTLEISSTGTLYSGGGNNYVVQVDAGATLKLAAWNYGATGGIGNSWFNTTTLLVNGGTITYANNGAAESVVDNSGRPITIGTGGATLNAAGSALWTITPYALASWQNQNIANGLTLTGSGNGVHQKNLTGSGGAVTKSGTGTWTLSGANTYSGSTTINDGVLIATAPAALSGYGTPGKVIVNGGTIGVRVGGSGWTDANINTLLNSATKTSGALGIDTTNGDFNQATAYTTTNLGSLGLHKLGANTLILAMANTYTGATTVSAGTLEVQGSIASSSGITNNAALIFNSNSPQSYGNAIDGTGTLTKQGSGTLTLSGTNTYSGATNVNEGTLIVNGSLGASSEVTVADGATLGGWGTITGDTVISGIHSPGNSPAVQTFGGNLTYEVGGVPAPSVEWELFEDTSLLANRGIQYDGINVGGDLTFTDETTFNLVFNAAGSFVDWSDIFWTTPHLGTEGWLVYSLTGSGSITNPGNLDLSISNWRDGAGKYFDTVLPKGYFELTIDGNGIYLGYGIIPEPSTAILAGLGLAGVCLRRRRK